MRQGFPVTETGFELALKPQATLEFLILLWACISPVLVLQARAPHT